jgi:1-deoxy-D-xylulose-5-phosphate synthase
MASMGKLLDNIQCPADLQKLPMESLPAVCQEAREVVIEAVGKSGGHLASNLGVAELTVALHYIFDFATDRLLWDVGHQCYIHKILTGRREPLLTSLRKDGGLSGFTSIEESPYDLFSVGHAGTAVPTAVGMARGDSLRGENGRRVVALVGDASIFNGVAFEGLNQAGLLNRQFLTVLNDNAMGIAPTQGSMAEYLARFRISDLYDEVKRKTQEILPKLPVLGKGLIDTLDHVKEGVKATISPHQIFEQLGFIYVGPVDGHDVSHLVELLQTLRDVPHPVLLHVHTQKGRGAKFAVEDPCTFHSPKAFSVEDDKATISSSTGKSWTNAFADALIDLAEQDDSIFAMTAAMPDGTGISKFRTRLPDRCMDVGIAESCTVDMAAGMAKSGIRPVVAIYSTFLQRAYDQIFQEVILQGLPVIFCIDRAGLVGGDGAVHHGFLDITYLRGMPKIVLAAPADEPELRALLRFAAECNSPIAIRYPRDNIPAELDPPPPFELGRSRMMREGEDGVILAYGSPVSAALDAAAALSEEGIEVAVVNARFAKPVDRVMVHDVVSRQHGPVVTVEDHSVTGGFGSAVLEAAQEMGLDASHVIRSGMPADSFIPHGSRARQLAECRIDADGIAATIRESLTPEGIRIDSEARSRPQRTAVG